MKKDGSLRAEIQKYLLEGDPQAKARLCLEARVSESLISKILNIDNYSMKDTTAARIQRALQELRSKMSSPPAA